MTNKIAAFFAACYFGMEFWHQFRKGFSVDEAVGFVKAFNAAFLAMLGE